MGHSSAAWTERRECNWPKVRPLTLLQERADNAHTARPLRAQVGLLWEVGLVEAQPRTKAMSGHKVTPSPPTPLVSSPSPFAALLGRRQRKLVFCHAFQQGLRS